MSNDKPSSRLGWLAERLVHLNRRRMSRELLDEIIATLRDGEKVILDLHHEIRVLKLSVADAHPEEPQEPRCRGECNPYTASMSMINVKECQKQCHGWAEAIADAEAKEAKLARDLARIRTAIRLMRRQLRDGVAWPLTEQPLDRQSS